MRGTAAGKSGVGSPCTAARCPRPAERGSAGGGCSAGAPPPALEPDIGCSAALPERAYPARRRGCVRSPSGAALRRSRRHRHRRPFPNRAGSPCSGATAPRRPEPSSAGRVAGSDGGSSERDTGGDCAALASLAESVPSSDPVQAPVRLQRQETRIPSPLCFPRRRPGRPRRPPPPPSQPRQTRQVPRSRTSRPARFGSRPAQVGGGQGAAGGAAAAPPGAAASSLRTRGAAESRGRARGA